MLRSLTGWAYIHYSPPFPVISTWEIGPWKADGDWCQGSNANSGAGWEAGGDSDASLILNRSHFPSVLLCYEPALDNSIINSLVRMQPAS